MHFRDAAYSNRDSSLFAKLAYQKFVLAINSQRSLILDVFKLTDVRQFFAQLKDKKIARNGKTNNQTKKNKDKPLEQGFDQVFLLRFFPDSHGE
ncbi:hypothetical protein ACW73I_09795 [Methylomonas sp. MgM2]